MGWPKMPSGVYLHKNGYKRPPFSEEWRAKLSDALKGRTVWNAGIKTGPNPELSAQLKGRTPWNKGKQLPPHTDEWKQKVSLAHKLSGLRPPLHCGSDCHLWRGGISVEPYSVDWTKALKQSIRERDGFVCQLCGEQIAGKTLSVHHIDYNKKNCDPANLISLCNKCHTKTNLGRDHWTEYFRGLVLT